METHFQHLTTTQRNKLLKSLQIFEELFDGTISTWKTNPGEFSLKENVKPICSRPYPGPKVHEEILEKEAKKLGLLGSLDVENDTKWRSPSFAQPKLK